jgi:hypothetical protein
MAGNLTLQEIEQQLHTVSEEFSGFCSGIKEELFFYQPADKWSVAQNVKHLITSALNTRLAFILPKFILRLYVGKPNRSSRSFEELVAKYKLKLEQGGRASGRYIPKPISSSTGKQKMLNDFSKSMNHLADSIQKKWKDAELDHYLAPHPLLGKITLRELCYFTIHHTRHHLRSIKSRQPG